MQKHSSNKSSREKSQDRLAFPPEIVFKAHIYHPDFQRDCVLFHQSMEIVKSQDLSEQNRREKTDELLIGFRNKYPLWAGPIPNYASLKRMKQMEGEIEGTRKVEGEGGYWVYWLEREKMDSAVVIDELSSVRYYDDSGEKKLSLNNKKRYLKIEIDMYAKNKDIESEIRKIIKRNKLIIFGYDNYMMKSKRNRREDIRHLMNFNIKQDAIEAGVSPATIAYPKKFKRKTSANEHEWDEYSREVRRSCQKVQEIFRQLGLPVLE